MKHFNGKLLRIYRWEAGLKQKDIAEKTGLSKSFVSDVEQGKRSISVNNFYRWTDVLGKEPNDFFEDDGKNHG